MPGAVHMPLIPGLSRQRQVPSNVFLISLAYRESCSQPGYMDLVSKKGGGVFSNIDYSLYKK